VTTNVTVYAEISDLAKLPVSEANYEIQLQSQRPNPVATHAGENVFCVMTLRRRRQACARSAA
jgi:hypothetical protein